MLLYTAIIAIRGPYVPKGVVEGIKPTHLSSTYRLKAESPCLGFGYSASGLLCLVPTERPYFPRPNSALVQNEQIYYHREPETAAKWRKW